MKKVKALEDDRVKFIEMVRNKISSLEKQLHVSDCERRSMDILDIAKHRYLNRFEWRKTRI